MSNKNKSAKTNKTGAAATTKTKAQPRRETVEGVELVEAPVKQDEPIVNAPEQTDDKKDEDELMTVQVGKHTIQVTKDPDGEVTEEDKKNAVDTEWILDRLAPYFDAYPEEKEFHLSSDGQVFLSKNKHDGLAHQKFLNDGKELLSFSTEK